MDKERTIFTIFDLRLLDSGTYMLRAHNGLMGKNESFRLIVKGNKFILSNYIKIKIKYFRQAVT